MEHDLAGLSSSVRIPPPHPPFSLPHILPSTPWVGHVYEDSCFRLCYSNRTYSRRCITSRVRLFPSRSPGQQSKVRFPCHPRPAVPPDRPLLHPRFTHVFPFSCHALAPSPFDHLCRLPKALTRRMILNLAISAAIGIVPIIGDVLIASYRANVRNARLLENFLLLRGERVAKGVSRAAPAISEKGGPKNNTDPGVDGDEGDSEEARGTDKARALPDAASLSQPGAGGASSSECEKTALVLDGADGDHEKDKSASASVSPVPEGTSEGEGVRVQLRPPRNPLELVQQRDSRFIEDVT